MNRAPRAACVLVDLDGTLADTAPDMAAAVNRLLVEEGSLPLPFDDLRPFVSYGAPMLVRRAFGESLEGAPFERLRQRFLELYEANLCDGTRVFPEFDDVLDELDARGLPWGVVTNKPGWLTEPLLDALGLRQRARSVISGDSLPQRKPHPAPLLRAADDIGVAAGACVYVGDAQRDIEAGRAAGMATIAAAWGYIPDAESAHDWAADLVAESPRQILRFLLGEAG